MYQRNDYCPYSWEGNWENNREENRENNREENWEENRKENWEENWKEKRKEKPEEQRHVHEITGSTAVFSEKGEECHNHRFATVSGEAIRCGNSHVHEVKFRTDFADGHFHEFCGTSSVAIEVGNGKHVHFASACTEEADGHKHKFQVASLIESPLDFECEA